MAALVGPEGEVVGADFDQSILRLAQREAEDLNLLQAPLPPFSPSSSTQ
jgi:ubiquinone/menaquinone biosynthesis C-methylase UbiE